MLQVNLGEASSSPYACITLGALFVCWIPASFFGWTQLSAFFWGVLVRSGLLLLVSHGSAGETTRTKISPRHEVDVPVQDRGTPGCYSRLRVFD